MSKRCSLPLAEPQKTYYDLNLHCYLAEENCCGYYCLDSDVISEIFTRLAFHEKYILSLVDKNLNFSFKSQMVKLPKGPKPSWVVGTTISTIDVTVDAPTEITHTIDPFELCFAEKHLKMCKELINHQQHLPQQISLETAIRSKKAAPFVWLAKNGRVQFDSSDLRKCCFEFNHREIIKLVDQLDAVLEPGRKFWDAEVRIACVYFERSWINNYVSDQYGSRFSKNFDGRPSFLIRIFPNGLRDCWEALFQELRAEIFDVHVRSNILCHMLRENSDLDLFDFFISKGMGNTPNFSPLAAALNNFRTLHLFSLVQHRHLLLTNAQYTTKTSADQNFYVTADVLETFVPMIFPRVESFFRQFAATTTTLHQ